MKFLSLEGVEYLWGKINDLVSETKATIDAYTVNGYKISENPVLVKADVGLGNVDNTSDADKPVSTAQQTALDKKVDKTTTINGYALSDDVTLEKADVGLGNVDNTSDADKPVSTAQKTYIDTATTKLGEDKVDKTTTINGYALDGNITLTKSDVGLGNVTNDAQVKRTEMGVANGVATLDASGLVPSSQLPSYVDDVLEYDMVSSFPSTGEAGKIYVAKDTNLTYRWTGTAYIEISKSLALGETSSTAYAGDKGAAAYKHAVTNKGAAFANGFYKITTNSEGHVTSAVKVTKTDITNLGIPAQDTKYTLPTATSSVLGGVKLGSDTKQTIAASAVSSTSGRTYAVQLNASSQAVVNVPWIEDTALSDTELDTVLV